jgi:hypothetical protein
MSLVDSTNYIEIRFKKKLELNSLRCVETKWAQFKTRSQSLISLHFKKFLLDLFEVRTSLYFVFMNKNFGFSAIPRKGINSFGLEKDKRKLFLVKFYPE